MFDVTKIKEPFALILVGPPLSGKSTWLRNNFNLDNITILSRDEVLLEVHGSDNYSLAFKEVNQKEVDRVLREKMVAASLTTGNVAVDMTHMGSKRRKANLNYFPNHYKVAVIFPLLSDEEYAMRNKKRSVEENKWIPEYVIKSMIAGYQPIRDEEGFDKVISVKPSKLKKLKKSKKKK